VRALVHLALASLWNRRFTAGLTLVSITLSVVLLLGVEKIRTEARDGFRATVSGTDLIVGARTGPVQLLLHSVFRIGNASASMSRDSHRILADRPGVAWTIPLSLGDAHAGFPVLGTTDAYLTHFRYGEDRALELAEGVWFDDLFDVVLGSEVAAQQDYRPGDEIVLSHGSHRVSFTDHEAMPFRISGVLAPTGTPVDRTLHVSLAAIEAIHLGWEAGVPLPGREVTAAQARQADLEPDAITAVLVGLENRAAVFGLQQAVNRFPGEPLLAILPGVALQQLFSLVGVAEQALLLVSALVVVAGLAGMMTMVLASLAERRREMAILRSVGARPVQILMLLLMETFSLTLIGALTGFLLVQLLTLLAGPALGSVVGILPAGGWPSAREWLLLAAVIAGGTLAGLWPAVLAYRRSLADGLAVRL
jgi:putative ABC transport system permease protein